MPSLRDSAIVFGETSRRLHAWLSNAMALPFKETPQGPLNSRPRESDELILFTLTWRPFSAAEFFCRSGRSLIAGRPGGARGRGRCCQD